MLWSLTISDGTVEESYEISLFGGKLRLRKGAAKRGTFFEALTSLKADIQDFDLYGFPF